jgi:hypothetical protein
MTIPFHSPTFTAHNVHRLLSLNFSARKANLGRDNNARTVRSLRIEIDELTRMCSQINLDKFTKNVSNQMKILSSLKTRIYPKWFPNASAVTWSLVLQARKLANKTEQFRTYDDLSAVISSSPIENSPLRTANGYQTPAKTSNVFAHSQSQIGT